MMRDSVNDPIQVGLLGERDHGLPGQIGLTIAPGKNDAPRGWHRDLEVDLSRLRDHFGVEVLVSLLEPNEYELLRIPQLIERAVAFGMETHRLAIRDVSVPDKVDPVRNLVGAILGNVAAGKTVLIHCRGGIGRSGLIAACCLVARGHEPADAIEHVRRVRPGAVETSEQERWVHDFAAGTVKNDKEPSLSRLGRPGHAPLRRLSRVGGGPTPLGDDAPHRMTAGVTSFESGGSSQPEASTMLRSAPDGALGLFVVTPLLMNLTITVPVSQRSPR